MTIYEVKRRHMEAFPTSHFFDRKTLRFFGQTMKDYHVRKYKGTALYTISAPIYIDGRNCGRSERFFNPATGELISQVVPPIK